MSLGSLASSTTITVRDFVIPARIGIYDSEHIRPQNIRVNVEMSLIESEIISDRIDDTVSYEGVVEEIRRMSLFHHELVENFAEELARFCLNDLRISAVTVWVEKTEIYPEGAVGARIHKIRPSH